MGRYAIFISFYFDAETDADAIYKSKYLASQQDSKNDDGCKVDEIRRAEFGVIERPVIYLLSKKEMIKK